MTTAMSRLRPPTDRRPLAAPDVARGEQATGHEINVRLLIVTAVVLLVVVPAAYFWHARQARNNAEVVLALVDESVAANDWVKASQQLARYLRLRPDDAGQRVRLAEVVDHFAVTRAQKEQSLRLHAVAIGLAPDRADLVRRRAELSYALGYFADAKRQADQILAKHAGDPAGLRVKALSLAAQARAAGDTPSEEVAQLFEQALRHLPDDVRLAVALAGIYRDQMPVRRADDEAGRQAKAALADRALDRLIEASPKSPDACLARYEYRRQYELSGAEDDLNQALALDPEGQRSGVCLAVAQRALEAALAQNRAAADDGEMSSGGDQSNDSAAVSDLADRATALFEKAIAADRHDERGYLGLGRARALTGDDAAALAAWRLGLQVTDPYSTALNFEIARASLRKGALDEVRGPLERVETELRRREGEMSPRRQTDWHRVVSALRADWLSARGQDGAAAGLFEGLLAEAADPASPAPLDEAAQADLCVRLGTALGRQGQWDRAIAAFERSVKLSPGEPRPRLALADAYQRGGRLDDAIAEYEQTLTLEGVPAMARLLAARALLEQQLQASADDRDWTRFDRALSGADQTGSNESEVALLLAQRELATGGAGPAARRLAKCVGESTDAEFCARAATALARWGQSATADECLKRAAAVGLPATQVALTEAALLVERGQKDAAQRMLTTAFATANGQARAAIGLRLAVLRLAGGKRDEARRDLEALARDAAGRPSASDPKTDNANVDIEKSRQRAGNYRHVVQMLAEMAWEDCDLEALARREREMRELEGPEGAFWRFLRGLRLAAEAEGPEDTRLAAAGRLQTEIEMARPGWPAGYLLKGRLAEEQKRPADAIAAYSTALRLGERRTQVYAYLARLLYQQERYGEAQLLLDELKRRRQLPVDLAELEFSVDVRGGSLDTAIETARRQAERHPLDAVGHVWLGQLLGLRGEGEAAEAALRQGVELAPQDARPWMALLDYYVRTGEAPRARQTFDAMRSRVTVSDKQRPFLLGQALERLADRDAAATAYREAMAAAPDELIVFQRAARFFRDVDRQQAEVCLRRILELKPESPLARRMLAEVMVGERGWHSLDDAVALLAAEGLDRQDETANQRMTARLMLRHGSQRQRQEAQQLLEDLVRADKQPLAEDRLLLAGLLERQGRFQAAKDHLLSLALADRPRPEHLAALVEFLLRHQRPTDAESWLNQLSQARPETESFRTLSARAGWLKQMERIDDIEPLVERFIAQQQPDGQKAGEQPSDKQARSRAALLTHAGGLYSASGLTVLAENTYRRAAEQHAAGAQALAQWLAEQGRAPEALRVGLDCMARDPSEASAVCLANLLTGMAADGADACPERAEAEQRLDEALDRFPDEPLVLVSAATWRMLRGDAAPALQLFQRALALEADNLVALNNVAILLADDPGQRDTAVAHLDRAMTRAGRHPELLDTKGWILLESDDRAGAEALFSEAAALAPDDPRPTFHLAVTWWAQGKAREAREALRRAKQGQLSVNYLSPRERSRLRELETELEGT
jgi:Tfp pilus assembly protein PilF